MASTALISYPHFKDLEKANTDFVEIRPNLKKSRRLCSDKKEQLANTKEQNNTECNITGDSDRYNSLRTKNKDIDILPTLDENEEKEEGPWMIMDNNKENKVQEILETTAIYETIGMHVVGDTANITKVNSKMQLKSKSNHSLVDNKSFLKQLSTENNVYDKPVVEPRELNPFSEKSKQSKEVAVNENKLYNTLCWKKDNPDNCCSHNLPKSTSNRVNNKPKTLNCERNLNTLMPNTTELQGINLNESVNKSLKQKEFESNLNKEYISMPTYTKCHAKLYVPNSSKCYIPAWKLVLAVLWTFTFMGTLTYIIITNIDKKINVVDKRLKNDNTNYEIVLLIAKNFRRLIVSSFYAFR